jgi:signal transduction histidine kinase
VEETGLSFPDHEPGCGVSSHQHAWEVRQMLGVLPKPAPMPSSLDESLATLAHELRNPIATIVFALQALPGEGDLAGQRARAIVEHEARRAMRLVDDLFDLCAGSWGKLSLHKEVVDLTAIVNSATEAIAPRLAARRHRLSVSLSSAPIFLVADPLRLEQVLANLLANAAKFTDPGGHICLSAGVEAGQVVVRLRDNGRGIAADLLPRVFDLFQQGPDPDNKGPVGIGIGLALVKSLVELHGGSVTAWSDGPGTGAEFIIRLPICPYDA